MRVVDDLVILGLLASSAFFVVLAFGLLIRYRQVSQRIASSNDLGKDLWEALEARLRKQDERILDVMGRMEVIQSRMTSKVEVLRPSVQDRVPVTPRTEPVTVTESRNLSPPLERNFVLDETEKTVMGLLKEKSRSSVEIKELLGKSREHAARLMKGLFDRGLVSRNDSNKPFVYALTETGRRYLSSK